MGGSQAGSQMGGQQAGGMNNPNQPGAMNGENPMGPATPMMGDKAFVKKALEGSMAEVQMGQLALQKSNDDQVKQFAQRMVDDHGEMIDQLKPVAQQLNVKVPDGPSKGAMKAMDKMKGLSGDAFDQAYIKDMVKDHKEDDKLFKSEAAATQSPQMKDMVMQADQTIESHLQQIEQIAQSKGVMGGDKKASM